MSVQILQAGVRGPWGLTEKMRKEDKEEKTQLLIWYLWKEGGSGRKCLISNTIPRKFWASLWSARVASLRSSVSHRMGWLASLPCLLLAWGAACGHCDLKAVPAWPARGSSWGPQGFCLLQWGTWAVHFHGEVLVQPWLYWDVEKREQEDKGIFVWQPHFFLWSVELYGLNWLKWEKRTELGKGLVCWRFRIAETERR